jgi:endonuclease/exonuclease/phosphatase family metal-dependent hydrolase
MIIRSPWFGLLAILTVTATGCHAQGNRALVAFYNCENFFDTENDPAKDDDEFTPGGKYHYNSWVYGQKQHNIAAVIQSMDNGNGPAIMGMAEVENNTVLSDLVRQPELARKNYKYIWYGGHDPRGINVALLYDAAQFQVTRSESIPVDLSGTGGKTATRDILHVRGVLRGDPVDVFVCHWPSRRGGEEVSDAKRAIVANTVKQLADRIFATGQAKVIIMGDLNDNPTDASVRNTLGASCDKTGTGQKGLYNPFCELYNKGGGSECYRHQWNMFDQMVISGALLGAKRGLSYDHAEVYKPEFIIDHYKGHEGEPHRSFVGTKWINGYSDHFPVALYLSSKN